MGCGVIAAIAVVLVVLPLALLFGLAGCGAFLQGARGPDRVNAELQTNAAPAQTVTVTKHVAACGNCRARVQRADGVCGACGARLVWKGVGLTSVCPHCRIEVRGQPAQCPECGAKFYWP